MSRRARGPRDLNPGPGVEEGGGPQALKKIYYLGLKLLTGLSNLLLGYSSDVLMQSPCLQTHSWPIYNKYMFFIWFLTYITWPTNSEDYVTSLHLNYSMVWNALLLSLSQYFYTFQHSYHTRMSFWRYVFPGIAFLGPTYPFLGDGWGGGLHPKGLKNFTDPVSFLRSLGPLGVVKPR